MKFFTSPAAFRLPGGTRIRVPNATGYKTVSTKTADLSEAQRFALNLYEETYMHVRTGGTLRIARHFNAVGKFEVTPRGMLARGAR